MKNAMAIVRNYMRCHKVRVTLPGEDSSRELYLILVSAETSLVEDLLMTFAEQINSTHLRLAKQIWGEKKTFNTYGVFIDDYFTNFVFAFNRLFADFKDGQLVYRDLDEIIGEAVGKAIGKADPSTSQFSPVSKPSFIPPSKTDDGVRYGPLRPNFPMEGGSNVLLP